MAGKNNKATPVNENSAPAGSKKIAAADTVKSSKLPVIYIIIFTALLYARALSNGFTFIDDDYYILNNPLLHDLSLKGLWAIFTTFRNYNYHPLTTLADLFLYKGFGPSPLPYHLLNVLLHLLNVWLVFVLAQKLSGKQITAIVVAALFAIHPMHVESVAWVSELKDVLYSAFYLGGLVAYLHYIKHPEPKYYAYTVLLFLGSLLSKSAAVTFPILLVVIDVYNGKKITGKSLAAKIPLVLLSLVFGIIAIKSQSAGGAVNDVSVYYNAANRIFLFTSGIGFYLISLIAPFNLNALHYYPDVAGNILPWYYYLSLPLLLAVTWLIGRKNTYRKDILFGVAFFIATIFVMLQIITVGASLAAERYTYIAYIGLFYIAGQWAADHYERRHKLLNTLFISIFALFSIITWMRIGIWRDTDTLFADIIEKNGNNWRNGLVYNSWADYEKYIGDDNGALQKYNEAIRVYPKYSVIIFNRGATYEDVHNLPAAIADYTEAIKLSPQKAAYYSARGWAYYQTGNKAAAMNDYNTALTKDPALPQAYNNRGWAYHETANDTLALADFDSAIAHAPLFTKPYYNRAMINAGQGKLAEAIADYTTLININSSDSLAYFNRGIIKVNQGDKQGACADWSRAAELGNTNAQHMLQQYCR